MPRPRSNNVTKTMRIDRPTMDAVEARLFDPFTQQLQHGALSRLTTMLYRGWLDGRFVVPSPLVDKDDDPLELDKLTGVKHEEVPTESSD